MKYIISESKLDSIIYDYISSNFYPDYNFDSFEMYKNSVDKWSYFDFNVNDNSAYVYFGNKSAYYKPKTLLIHLWLSNRLTELFGDNWIPTFARWFEDNVGLPVEHVETNFR